MKTIKFHFYKGKSLVSKLIKWRTNGIYSHVSVELDGVVYEAWVGSGASGVVKSTNTLYYHTPKTEYDTIEVAIQNWNVWKTFLENQVGKKYDYMAIISFVKNRIKADENKWFCSELAMSFLPFEFPKFKGFNGLISPQAFNDILISYNLGLSKNNI